MNIPYSTIVRSTVDGEVAATHIANVKQALLDAGWTSIASKITGTFTGVPSNNQTVTVGSKVYTYKTTLTGAADEIFIGADATACANNLKRAINDDGVEGTNYGVGTTANADATATDSVGVITLSVTAGTSITLAEGLSNFTWQNSAVDGGFTLISKSDHPCKYRLVAHLYTTSSTAPRIKIMDESRTRSIDLNWLTLAAGRGFFCRATPYDFWIIRTGGFVDYVYGGALYNPSDWAPKTVVGATNGSPSSLNVTAHGFSNGQLVTLSGFSGTGWADENGKSYAVTVTDANNFTIALDSSSFGAATGGFAGGPSQIGLSLFASSNLGASNSGGHFRNMGGHAHAVANLCGRHWWAFNEYTVDAGNQGSNLVMATAGIILYRGFADDQGTQIGTAPGYNYRPCEIVHGISSATGTTNSFKVGAFWNAVFYDRQGLIESDLDQIPLNSRKFFNIRIGTNNGTSDAASNGAVFIEVPTAP